jgi:hypothetical protein
MSMESTIVMNITINNNKDISMFNTFINKLFLNSEENNPLFKVETTDVVKRKGRARLEVRISSIGNDKSFFMKQINDLFFSFPLTITYEREYFEHTQINDIGD